MLASFLQELRKGSIPIWIVGDGNGFDRFLLGIEAMVYLQSRRRVQVKRVAHEQLQLPQIDLPEMTLAIGGKGLFRPTKKFTPSFYQVPLWS